MPEGLIDGSSYGSPISPSLTYVFDKMQCNGFMLNFCVRMGGANGRAIASGSGTGKSKARSRSRSKTRYRDRSRSSSRDLRRRLERSRSRDVSRSVSRELLRGEEAVGEIAKLVQTQQEVLLDLLQEHKVEVETKLQQKGRKFGNRQLEKQNEVNSGFLEVARKAQASANAGDARRAGKHLEELIQLLEAHEQDLLIADASPHGWLAVSKIRSTKELPKNIRKRLAEVDRQLSSQKDKPGDGQAPRKPSRFQGQGAGPVFRRADRRVSPEEALFEASKQLRPGSCSHCQKGLHFYRECPEFWRKVQAAREAKAKDPQPAQED